MPGTEIGIDTEAECQWVMPEHTVLYGAMIGKLLILMEVALSSLGVEQPVKLT